MWVHPVASVANFRRVLVRLTKVCVLLIWQAGGAEPNWFQVTHNLKSSLTAPETNHKTDLSDFFQVNFCTNFQIRWLLFIINDVYFFCWGFLKLNELWQFLFVLVWVLAFLPWKTYCWETVLKNDLLVSTKKKPRDLDKEQKKKNKKNTMHLLK